jgi:hypothetical protein
MIPIWQGAYSLISGRIKTTRFICHQKKKVQREKRMIFSYSLIDEKSMQTMKPSSHTDKIII